jgi:hypothetical protein
MNVEEKGFKLGLLSRCRHLPEETEKNYKSLNQNSCQIRYFPNTKYYTVMYAGVMC